MHKITRSFHLVFLLTLLFALGACSSGSGGGGSHSGGGSSYGSHSSPNITADDFVDALNRIDPQYADSYVVRDYWDSERTYVPGEEDWFVIYDAKYGEYKAVSLQFLRSIVYYDYYRNDSSVADEFRDFEDDDISYGDFNGDYYGDDYEVTDYDPYTDLYFGRNSGYAYEDEQQTYDVGLMQAENQQRQFIQKASAISFQYEVSIETSMALITLGEKVEGMFQESGEITPEDQQALMGDLQHLTGATLEDVAQAATDKKKQDELIDKIANEIGANADSLQHKILPEIFGLQL